MTMKNKLARKKEIERAFKESHVLLLIEDVREDIKVAFDGITGLRDRFDSFELETRANFKAIFEYLIRIEDEIASIKMEVSKIKIGKTDWASFKKLKTRVEKVEKENFFLRSILEKKGLLAKAT